MNPLIDLAACEFLLMSARDRLSGPDADAARRVIDAVGWRWDLKLRELEISVPPMEEPAEEGAPLSIAELIGAADWPGASEATKALLESMGAPSGAFRVYVVPESATVTVDFGGGE